ncbi:MAG: T9SS type A sorting domain-containing protein, partial [Ignavibacteriales bacterium]|nr:T9SS type A sorting domain-containing protein [Ignavibacteriales bacterium]
YTITWDDNLSENIKIELFKGGVFNSEIISSTPSNDSYNWTIPSALITGTDYKIRISSTIDTLLYDESNANFSIRDAIIVTYPNGGEVLNKNASYTITWDDNLSENVKIDLYKGGMFDSEIISSTPSNGSYVWAIPSGLTTGDDYKIRIASTIDSLLFNESDDDFTIRDAIIVTYPNGGERLNKNATYTITWDDNISENVRIELYKGGIFNSTIVNSTLSNGSYNWTIPSGITNGTDYTIHISSTTNGLLFDESDSVFSIRDAIIITYPNGGERLNKNTTYSITWDDNLIEDVKIDLYKDGVFNSIIVNSTPSNGSFNWTIQPEIPIGTDYKVRITSTVNTLLYDESDFDFTIEDTLFLNLVFPISGTIDIPFEGDTLKWFSNGVEYDIYLGLDSNLTINDTLATKYTSQSIFTGALEQGTNYYWKVVAYKDAFIDTTDTWHFKTKIAPLYLALISPTNTEQDLPSGGVNLTWDTNGDTSIVYFGTDLSATNLINGLKQDSTSFFTGELINGLTYYWKVIVKRGTESDTIGIFSFKVELPDEFIIHPNYPNPFSYSTTIEYDLPEHSNVRIVIYDVSGKMVKELLNEYQEARSYLYEWDGTDGFGHKAGSGIYVLVINAESTQSSKKMFKSLKMSFVK